jgi:hypothetical protein
MIKLSCYAKQRTREKSALTYLVTGVGVPYNLLFSVIVTGITVSPVEGFSLHKNLSFICSMKSTAVVSVWLADK